MAGFGLQFLNGLGESQDQGVQKVDLENKSFVSDADFEVERIEDDTEELSVSTTSKTETPYQEEKSKIVTAKILLIFLAGAATGLLVRKLLNKRK